ncbi:MAG TPA: hypothetical protein VKG26_08430, partial [Bacteroidia bacterium]|nr:hypothetical protein [Bacteroidia bacterium]
MKSLSTKHKTFLVAILCLFAFSKNLKAQDTLRMRALQNVINDMYLFWVLDSGDTKINDVVCYYSLLDSVGELTINYRGIQDLSKPDMQKANLPQKTKK